MPTDRSKKPEAEKAITFHLPEIEKFTLQNDLQVYFIKKTNLPMLQFVLVAESGSSLDPENMHGLSNLFAMMLDEGAGDFGALELSDEFHNLGANFRVRNDEDNVFLSLQCLKDNYKIALKLFGDVVADPHFNEKNFPREKRKVETRIIQVKDDPGEIANNVFEYILFRGINPYAYPCLGIEEDLANITNDSIKNFYESCFMPDNSSLIVVGDSCKEELENTLNQILGRWTKRNHSPQLFNKAPVPGDASMIYLVNKPGSPQSEIRAGHPSTNRLNGDFFPKTILNTILGGQFSSRINLNLREKKGYTYGAYSRFSHYKNDAFFSVSVSVNAENTGDSIMEILSELTKIREGVTGAELDFAKSSLIRKFPSNFETYYQTASNLTGMVIYSLPENYFNTYIEKINNVSHDDVKKAAEENIFPENTSIIVVADRDKVIDQLNNYGSEKVIEVDYRGESILPGEKS